MSPDLHSRCPDMQFFVWLVPWRKGNYLHALVACGNGACLGFPCRSWWGCWLNPKNVIVGEKNMFKSLGHGGHETFDLELACLFTPELNQHRAVKNGAKYTHYLQWNTTAALLIPDAESDVLLFTFFPSLCGCRRLFSSLTYAVGLRTLCYLQLAVLQPECWRLNCNQCFIRANIYLKNTLQNVIK